MSTRYLHALWCDDIRQEVGNKPSFMGAYIAGITVPALPFAFPKLCVYLWASTPIDKPFEKALVKVTRDDGFLVAEISTDNLEQLPLFANTPADAKTGLLMFGINMNGFEIPENCKYFTVTMETESEILEGPKLRISVAQPPTQPH